MKKNVKMYRIITTAAAAHQERRKPNCVYEENVI